METKGRGWPPGCGRLAKVAGLMLWRKWVRVMAGLGFSEEKGQEGLERDELK